MSWVDFLVDRVMGSGAFSKERAPLRIKVLATILFRTQLERYRVHSRL